MFFPLGLLFPLVLLGIIIYFKDNLRERFVTKNLAAFSYLTFIVSWSLFSILLGLLHYIWPAFSIFSDRALILFPTPFLAAVGLKVALDIIRAQRFFLSLNYLKKIIILLVIAIVFASGLLVTTSQVFSNYKVTISSTTYQKLVWLSDNYSSEVPIFIFNDFDQYAGPLGNLNNNWVKACLLYTSPSPRDRS